MHPAPAYSVSRTHTIIFAVVLILLSVMAIMHFHRGDRGDKAWKLEATQELYAGKKLYTDIFEMNPPSQFWLYSIPVYLSSHFPPLKDYHFLVLMGMLTVSYVVYICSRLMALHPMFMDDKRKKMELCLLLATVLVTFQYPVYFFDREHIFFVLILPYIFRFMPSLARAPVPPTLSMIIGLLAGVGFCIKPHCLIVFAGIQLMYFWRERSLAILRSRKTSLFIYCKPSIWHASGFILPNT